jgi:hypothetical protein
MTFAKQIGDWHFWEGTQFMASYEPSKELHAFESVDECINYLYQHCCEVTARTLWQEWKNQ